MNEIERKFLVKTSLFQVSGHSLIMRQGYLSVDPTRVVRVRVEGEQAWLTIKGKMEGITRPEWEYDIPVSEALEMLKLSIYAPIEKIRHRLQIGNQLWEVDEFLGQNSGLWLAEIELNDENEPFDTPDWLGEEVTHDRRYYNSQLSQNPWSKWK